MRDFYPTVTDAVENSSPAPVPEETISELRAAEPESTGEAPSLQDEYIPITDVLELEDETTTDPEQEEQPPSSTAMQNEEPASITTKIPSSETNQATPEQSMTERDGSSTPTEPTVISVTTPLIVVEAPTTPPPVPATEETGGDGDPPKYDLPKVGGNEDDDNDDKGARDEPEHVREKLPEQTTEPEVTAAELPPCVVTDERRIGNTEVVTVLCQHTEAYTDDIAEKLNDCDIIALEGIIRGGDVEDRGYAEELYTTSLSTELPEEEIKEAHNKVTKGAVERGYQPDDIIRRVAPADQKVVLVDLQTDHPDYHLVQKGDESYNEFLGSIERLEPLEVTKAANQQHIQDTAAVNKAREARMAELVQGLANTCNQTDEQARIGVVVGMSHRDLVHELGEPADPVAAQQHIETLSQSIYPSDLLIEATKRGDDEEVAELGDRHLIAHYIGTIMFYDEQGQHRSLPQNEAQEAWDRANQHVKNLEETQVDHYLSLLSQNLADQTEAFNSRVRKVQNTLQPLMGNLGLDK